MHKLPAAFLDFYGEYLLKNVKFQMDDGNETTIIYRKDKKIV